MTQNRRCNHCQIGLFQPVTAPYLEMIDGLMMAVTSMPAQRCDVCGSLEYDAVQMGRLHYLIDHPAPEYKIKPLQNQRSRPSRLPQPLPTR